MDTREAIEKLEELRRRVQAMGGPERVEKQHAAGKWTARERIDALLDPGTFQELHAFARHRAVDLGMAGKEIPADGVVTGAGAIDGRLAFVSSQDFTVAGGTAGEIHARKIVSLLDQALLCGAPVVLFNDSGGARIQEGVDALAGYGGIFHRNTLLSGVVPQISVISGPCAGGAAYSPAITDFIIMVKGISRLFITGPEVIKEVTGEEVTAEELGGAEVQTSLSGVAHFLAEDETDAVRLVRRLLAFLPNNNTQDPPGPPGGTLVYESDPALDAVLPDDPREPYDMRAVIFRVIDGGDFLEVHEHFAPNILVGFGRMQGRTVGVVANQPSVLGGALDINASVKAARFIRFCNAFNIPLVNFVDVPGFMPGVKQEYGGIIRHGAKMLFAYAASTVPKITVVTRKAYGGSFLAMCAKSMGADRVFAWPTAEIGVMGAEGAVQILYGRELASAPDPAASRRERIEEYRSRFASPYLAAARMHIDNVIEPRDTREYVSFALETLRNKRELRPPRSTGRCRCDRGGGTVTSGLVLALVGLAVTFFALAALALVMAAIGAWDRGRRERAARRSRERAISRSEAPEEIPGPIVAVIAAAVESSWGRRARVQRVRYLAGQEAAWARMGRQEVMASHAVVRRRT